MKYISTRGNYEKTDSAMAIKLGMVPNGGLFVPESFPQISLEEIGILKEKSYQDLAKKILSLYLSDFTEEEIVYCVEGAYSRENFDTENIIELEKITDQISVLELWHGPTAAFKDMALQIMPYFLRTAKKKLSADKNTIILVATSGDTGKAALEGFKNIDGIKIIIFYPEDGVSEVQKLQMNTTEGNNTCVVSVKGNFDDCQTGVKEIFSDNEFKKLLDINGFEFSSANSINWGRLSPQIIYYFGAYIDLLKKGEIALGDKINFTVPTGNFGNILAGYYAKQMGLPINKLVCASNKNNILTDFFATGSYDRNREFYKTMSPSMDILISSNLERFLFELSGNDGELINSYYKSLSENGKFEVSEEIKAKMDDFIIAGYVKEDEVLSTIKNTYETNNYVIDTHTAVALKIAQDTGLEGKMVVDSTASPYKFSGSVLEAIKGKAEADEFDSVARIDELNKTKTHRAVKGLKEKEILHGKVIKKEDMKLEVMSFINR